MYAFEIFGQLLFVSFVVSCLFFLTLTVHSLVETRRKEAAGQDKIAQSGKRVHGRSTLDPLGHEGNSWRPRGSEAFPIVGLEESPEAVFHKDDYSAI